MFIYNVKLNSSMLFKIIFAILIICVLILCFIIGINLYKSTIKSNDTCVTNDFTEITNKNYANILKATHDNIDSYLGTKIKFSGFVYRVYDLEKNQFVLGRNMIISSDFQTVVVGFLCNYDDAILFKDFTWVEIEGTLEKCTYHNQSMPIIKITSIKEINKPEDEYVYPPDENYVPTAYMF